MRDNVSYDFAKQRQWNQQNAVNAIAYTNVDAKTCYNNFHQSLLLKSENKIFIQLHYEYKLSGITNIKKTLQQQCVELFTIKKRVENLVYQLNLLKNWKIHNVIFVTQLKSVSVLNNLYICL